MRRRLRAAAFRLWSELPDGDVVQVIERSRLHEYVVVSAENRFGVFVAHSYRLMKYECEKIFHCCCLLDPLCFVLFVL